MEITQQQKEAAYKAAESGDIKGVLNAIFGEAQKKDNRPVTERVKTFEDAVKELGENHPFVNIYDTMVNEYPDAGKDVIAYLKLRIIVAALNEGWEPEFVADEERWYPWFWLYTNEEMSKMDEKKKANCRVVGRANYNADAYGGLAYAHASSASSFSSANFGSRLAFRTEELAEYAGKQFIEEYYQMNVGL